MSAALTLTHDRSKVRSRTADKISDNPEVANTANTVYSSTRKLYAALKNVGGDQQKSRDSQSRHGSGIAV